MGSNIVKSFETMKWDVLAVDFDEEIVTFLSKDVHHSLIVDATKMSVLRDLGAQLIDFAVVCIGNNLKSSILTVMNLKKLGVKKIIVKADEILHKEIFLMLDATEVIILEVASAIRLAIQITSDSILDYYAFAKNYDDSSC